jgi:hypothetical protein
MFRHPNAIFRGLLVPFLSYSSFSLRFGWMELLFAWCGHLLRNARYNDKKKNLHIVQFKYYHHSVQYSVVCLNVRVRPDDCYFYRLKHVAVLMGFINDQCVVFDYVHLLNIYYICGHILPSYLIILITQNFSCHNL